MRFFGTDKDIGCNNQRDDSQYFELMYICNEHVNLGIVTIYSSTVLKLADKFFASAHHRKINANRTMSWISNNDTTCIYTGSL